MNRVLRDRILGIAVIIFAAILLVTSSYGVGFPELFIRVYVVTLFGFSAWLAMTLFRWELVYRISVTVWSILLIVFLMLLSEITSSLHLHISAAALIVSMAWIIFHGRIRARR